MTVLFLIAAVSAIIIFYQLSPQRKGTTAKTLAVSFCFLGAGALVLVLTNFGVDVPSPMMLIAALINRLVGA